MPKLNPERAVLHERLFARRVREEREDRGLSLEDLAHMLTAAGCPIDRQAIHRIEQGRRRVTLDEAVNFAHVFGKPIGSLVLPIDKEAVKLFARHKQLWEQFEEISTELRSLEGKLLTLADDGYEAEVLDAIERVKSSTPGQVQMTVWRLLRGDHAAILTDDEKRSHG